MPAHKRFREFNTHPAKARPAKAQGSKKAGSQREVRHPVCNVMYHGLNPGCSMPVAPRGFAQHTGHLPGPCRSCCAVSASSSPSLARGANSCARAEVVRGCSCRAHKHLATAPQEPTSARAHLWLLHTCPAQLLSHCTQLGLGIRGRGQNENACGRACERILHCPPCRQLACLTVLSHPQLAAAESSLRLSGSQSGFCA
jgi:hypothetical protein